jgi:hypothetical protein
MSRLDADTVADAVASCFTRIYRQHFLHEDCANHALPVQVRAFRCTEGWYVMLVLTPWMLARMFLTERAPGLAIPPGWSPSERAAEPYVVIGPAVELPLLGATQPAHLNYDPVLGHYLIQPLVLALARFDCADAVFEAWNDVIATRVRVMEEQKRECAWQREVSRREFFTRLGNGGS